MGHQMSNRIIDLHIWRINESDALFDTIHSIYSGLEFWLDQDQNKTTSDIHLLLTDFNLLEI